MRDLARYLSGDTSWRKERRIVVAQIDLPEVKVHTAIGCPKGTFQVVIIPSLDVRKRSPLARPPRGISTTPAIKSHTAIQFSAPTSFGQGSQGQLIYLWSVSTGPRTLPSAAAADRSRCLPPQNYLRNASTNYLTSTLAPASSTFFLMAAASSLLTPSFTVFGAPSTRSLASFSPRLVTSRTALITLILLPPTSVRTTVNSFFSSSGAAAAAPPPPAATTVAAAADTPNASSIFFTRADASRSVKPLISSRIVSTFAMTACSPLKNVLKFFLSRGGLAARLKSLTT